MFASVATPVRVVNSAGILTFFTSSWTASPFHALDINAFGWGMVAAVLGVIGRCFIEIQKTIEAGDRVKLARSLGWTGAGIATTPFVTLLWLSILASIHWPVDPLALIILLLTNFAGPKGAMRLVGLAGNVVSAAKGAKMLGDIPAEDAKESK